MLTQQFTFLHIGHVPMAHVRQRLNRMKSNMQKAHLCFGHLALVAGNLYKGDGNLWRTLLIRQMLTHDSQEMPSVLQFVMMRHLCLT